MVHRPLPGLPIGGRKMRGRGQIVVLFAFMLVGLLALAGLV
jgi:hypothetical protein